MHNTLFLFEERKKEVEFYYATLENIYEEKVIIKTSDNSLLFRILKSNFLLMLYNLIEACITSGIKEIDNEIFNNNTCFMQLTDDIKLIWLTSKIKNINSNVKQKKLYKKHIKNIIEEIACDNSIKIGNTYLKISGNLDAKVIRELCEEHRIPHRAKDKNGYLRTVKEKRQNLAHGDESFGDCSRDLTLSQLKEIKESVLCFIAAILDGMKQYCDNKLYIKKVVK